jgi:hypothetical protein
MSKNGRLELRVYRTGRKYVKYKNVYFHTTVLALNVTQMHDQTSRKSFLFFFFFSFLCYGSNITRFSFRSKYPAASASLLSGAEGISAPRRRQPR